MLRHLIVSLVLLALAGGFYYLLTPQGRQLIDRVHIHMMRAEYKSLHRAGEPLPGTPDLAHLDVRLQAEGVHLGAPVYIRIFKLESELELWVEKEGRFQPFATYPICLWSGRLGPKLKEGDRQAPEGFYTVAKEQLNYAVTDKVVDEIWALVTAALDNGQERIPVHAFPFRMTERNLNLRKGYKWNSFWTDLKTGYDLFERSHLPPVVSVCDGRYVFRAGSPATVNSPVEARCPPEVAGNS
jgi:murein L,D-transpeptidase YafK